MDIIQLVDDDAKGGVASKRAPRTKRTNAPSSLNRRKLAKGKSQEAKGGTEAPALVLPHQFDGAYAGELLSRVKGAVSAGTPLLVDGSAVERAFTPALQVLVVALRTKLGSSEFVARLTDPSETLVDALRDLGLATYVNAGKLQ